MLPVLILILHNNCIIKEENLMKQGNLDRWINLEKCTNLLFFSELVNELLFDYSIPSNRVGTLNTHYLCLDAINTINTIESSGVPEGTLKPIVEELYSSLLKDPVYEGESDNPLIYFVKCQKDKYRKTSNTAELNYEEQKKTIQALYTRFFCEQKYYEKLKTYICQIVKDNKESEQRKLFRLTKAILTELINIGYDSRYIFSVMRKLFWESEEDVKSPEDIEKFFSYFTLEKKDYRVVLKVNKTKMDKIVENIDGLSFENLEPKSEDIIEKRFLKNKKNDGHLVLKVTDLDPYIAKKHAIKMINTNSSFYRMMDHDYRYDVSNAQCGVYEGDSFIFIPTEKGAVEHSKKPSKVQIKNYLDVSDDAIEKLATNRSIEDALSIISAVQFHSHALDSKSQENQLLDFWAIFESVLDISNKHTSDRINQVCIHLIPILKRKYVYSLILQLSEDIKNFDEEYYNMIMRGCDSEIDKTARLFKIISLPNLIEERNELCDKCKKFPLLKERIEYYTETFCTLKSTYEFVEKHAQRVKWQIMRIYRNRNLIIHNGHSMPYLTLLIENLHSYVDDFLEYTVQNMAKGHTINSMCQNLFAKECEWLADFSNKKNNYDEEKVQRILEF